MITVASYNIKCGALTDFEFTPIARDISAVNADIVGVQEVDRLTRRNGGIDTMPRLSEAAKLKYHAFAPAMPYSGGHYGIGCLSRFEPESIYRAPLPCTGDFEPRTFMSLRLTVHGRKITFLNTHLSFESKDLQKLQISALSKYLNALDTPFILTGDFNTDCFKMLEELGSDITLMNNSRNYFPSFYPENAAIDNIIISKELKFITRSMYTVTENSDHYMIYAQIAL